MIRQNKYTMKISDIEYYGLRRTTFIKKFPRTKVENCVINGKQYIVTDIRDARDHISNLLDPNSPLALKHNKVVNIQVYHDALTKLENKINEIEGDNYEWHR